MRAVFHSESLQSGAVQLLVALLAAPVSAYEDPEAKVRKGDEVRIKASSLEGEFVVQSVEPEQLTIRALGELESHVLPLSAIEELNVRRPLPQKEARIRHAQVGLLLGAGIGAVIGFAQGSDPPCSGQELCFSMSAGGKAALYGVVLGLSGALFGGLVGLGDPGTTWEPVDLGAGFALEVRTMGVEVFCRF